MLRGNKCVLVHSSDDSQDHSSSSSSIVFQSLSQPLADPEGLSLETQPAGALVSTQEGHVICPKTLRRIPENYIPCVFLGQGRAVNGSKCPAMGFDSSALQEPSNRNSPELNNNPCMDKECRQQMDRRQRKTNKEVGPPNLAPAECKRTDGRLHLRFLRRCSST